MTVSELIMKIDNLINLNLSVRLDVSQQTIEQAMQQDDCCKKLLACCNFVSDELFTKAASNCRTIVAQAADGLIDTSLLKIGKVISLVDSSGNNVPFKYAENGIVVKQDGKYNLTYYHASEPLGFDSEIVLPNCKITERIFTYGVAAEYLRIEGDRSQSASWAEKYNQALSVAMLSGANGRLPNRRWLS